MQAKTQYELRGFGDHFMRLESRETGDTIVTGTRDPSSLEWTIHAEGVPDITAPTVTGSAQPRASAIQAMCDHAVTATPSTFSTTTVQPGLWEIP